MSIFITFHDIWISQPEVLQNTATAKLGASAQMLGQAGGVFAAGAATIGQLNGNAQSMQSSKSMQLIQQGAMLGTSVTQTANMVNNSANVMKAAKTRLTGLVATARGLGFLVDLNTGVVSLTPAQASGYQATVLTAKMVELNDQIQTTVFQVNAHDISVKLGLAATALGVVNFVLGMANGSGSTPTTPDTSIPAGTPLPTSPLPTSTPLPPWSAPSTPALTPLGSSAAHGGLGSAADPKFGLAGAGGLGAAPMGGAGALGPGGLGSPGGGTVVAGVAGLSGANQPPGVVETGALGQSGAPGGSMVGMGGAPMGGAGRNNERRESSTWRQLTEDEDVWGGDDIPDTNDGVLA
jgi:hypothetical protein